MSQSYHQRPPGVAAFNAVYAANKRGAKLRGLLWAVSKEQYYALSQQNCHYCGEPPSNVCRRPGSGGEFKYNGVDRVDNDKGYEADNLVPCCRRCNRAKNTASVAEFMAWIEKVYKYGAQKES